MSIVKLQSEPVKALQNLDLSDFPATVGDPFSHPDIVV